MQKKDKWKWVIVFLILIAATAFLYISRSQEGILFLVIGIALYLCALLIINYIDKKSKY
jgi:lipopolysaccharide export LptBFGC system permease protein LptF